jgi:transcriptional regulator with XRE-family HTH domain
VINLDSESIAKLAQIVDDYMGDRDMTVRDFAKKAGVSSSHVQNIKKGNFKDLQISTLAKIAEAMGFDFVELVLRIGLADKPRDIFSADELSRVAPKPYKEILEKHGDLVIRIAEKVALSDISPKQLEKIVDAIAEIKWGN